MITLAIESVPTQWTEVHDVAFFRSVADVLPRSFLDGATVLLASYDSETDDVVDEQTAERPATALSSSLQPAMRSLR